MITTGTIDVIWLFISCLVGTIAGITGIIITDSMLIEVKKTSGRIVLIAVISAFADVVIYMARYGF